MTSQIVLRREMRKEIWRTMKIDWRQFSLVLYRVQTNIQKNSLKPFLEAVESSLGSKDILSTNVLSVEK